MAYRIATSTAQAAWECRWAREGRRLSPNPGGHPEATWICVRPTVRGARRLVTEAECETCPHWEVDEFDGSER
jgi:hypothetical protein